MKKFLAILLAMMLVMVSVAALADGNDNPSGVAGTSDTNPTTTEGISTGEGGSNTQKVSIDPKTAESAAGNPTTAVTVTIPKVISATKDEQVYDDADKHPEVNLSFTVVSKSVELSTVTTAPDVTIEGLTIAEGAKTGELKITLPSYSAVGIYTYTVTENATNIAGMTEATNLELKVTVIQNTETGNLQIAGIAVRQDSQKTDEIENQYKSGRLKVTKVVAGNMGDRTKEFPITITLNAPDGKTVASTVTYKVNDGEATSVTFANGTATVNVNLKHKDYVEISNIPEGVTYTVAEDADIKHVNTPDAEQTNVNAYKVGGEITEDTDIAVAKLTSYEITNTKEIKIDTGITLEPLPYVLLMVLAAMGLVVLKLRKREDY